MPFLNIILIPLNSATRMCYVDFGSASSSRYYSNLKKIPKVQIMRQTWHAQELTITRKSLGLIWKGLTFNSLKRLLLKP